MSVLDVEPDLAKSLSDEECVIAERFALPVATVDEDGNLSALIEASGAFGALILDGLLAQAVTVGEHPTLALIGPGALAPLAPPATLSLPVADSELRVLSSTRCVLLGERFLLAAARWPQLVAGLHARMLEHTHRLTVQLAISQLPRAEDRLMWLMWLLAESWGHVTPIGIRLGLSLSHEALGALIGARRPTVTLALGQLADRGSLIKQGDEWLILEAPPSSPADSTLQARHVRLTNGSRPQWRPELPAPKPTRRLEEESQLLLEKLTQLHLDTDQNRQLARRLTADMRALRDERRAIVNDIAAQRANGSNGSRTRPPLATAISTSA